MKVFERWVGIGWKSSNLPLRNAVQRVPQVARILRDLPRKWNVMLNHRMRLESKQNDDQRKGVDVVV